MNTQKRSFYILLGAASILMFFSFTNVSAQNFIDMNTQQNQPSLSFRLPPSDKTVEGSPYFKDEWESGIVHQKNKTFVKLDEMKYDVLLDEIIFKHEGNHYRVPKKVQIDKFQMGNEKFIGAFDQNNNYLFFHVLEGNEHLYLLKKYDCTVKKGEPSKGYIAGTNDKYVIKERIFVKKENQNALEINPRKGEEMISVLNEEEKNLVEDFISKNKLKMKKVEDLQKVVDYYMEQASL